jgi:hypothetical protein
MVLGGQPMKVAGVPVVDPTDATTVVAPGPFAVTTPFVSTVPTAVLPDDQLNAPTFEVISVPPLNAVAENCSVWFCDTQTGELDGPATAILSTCAWTKTGTVAVRPLEATVMLAEASGSGVPLLLVWQTTLLASKIPAQTSPADDTVTTLVFDDVYVTAGVGVIAVLVESKTCTVVNWVTSP